MPIQQEHRESFHFDYLEARTRIRMITLPHAPSVRPFLPHGHNPGYITQAEMQRYLAVSLRAAGGARDVDAAAHEATQAAFRLSDRNHDGVLSFDEFRRWYVTHALDAQGLGDGGSGGSSSGGGGGGLRVRGTGGSLSAGGSLGGGGGALDVRVPTATFCYEVGSRNDRMQH